MDHHLRLEDQMQGAGRGHLAKELERDDPIDETGIEFLLVGDDIF
jgi:hypothetical protein